MSNQRRGSIPVANIIEEGYTSLGLYSSSSSHPFLRLRFELVYHSHAKQAQNKHYLLRGALIKRA